MSRIVSVRGSISSAIYIARWVNSECNSTYDTSTEETRIASWSTGMKGLDWLNKLAKEKKILDLGGNGYPYRYSAKTSEILPIISSGIPSSNEPIIVDDDYVLQANEIRSLKLDVLKISKCGSDDHLLIEAWDQS